MKKLFVFFVLLGFVLNACKSTNSDIKPIDFKFAIGQIYEYKVTVETFSLSAIPVVSTYYIQEKIVDSKISNGETIFSVEQARKTKLTDSWTSIANFSINQTERAIIRYENSIPYKILAFPVSENFNWNLNEYNSKAVTNLTYTKVGSSFSKYNASFTVLQNADSSLIDLKKHYSVYSPSDGMVYKEASDLNYCQKDTSCIGKNIISYGTRTIWTRIN